MFDSFQRLRNSPFDILFLVCDRLNVSGYYNSERLLWESGQLQVFIPPPVFDRLIFCEHRVVAMAIRLHSIIHLAQLLCSDEQKE